MVAGLITPDLPAAKSAASSAAGDQQKTATMGLSPWLPWLAAGYALGCAAPAWFHNDWQIFFLGLVWLWSVPLLAFAIRHRAAAFGQRLLAFLLCFCAGMVAVGPTRALPTPQFIASEAVVSRVLYQGFSTAFLVDLAPPIRQRVMVRSSQSLSLRSDDRIFLHGRLGHEVDRWGETRAVLIASRVNLLQPREQGSRGFAWQALERLGPQRDLAAALLLGEGRPAARDSFHGAGLLHILAVSGLHLGLALVLLAQGLRLFGCPWWLRQTILILGAASYAWLAGMSLPTQRAMIMTVVVVCYGLSGREQHRLGPLSLAVIILLIIDPYQAQEIGFQLSALAVFGILTIGLDGVALRRHLLPLRSWPLDRPLWRGLLKLGHGAADGLVIGLAASIAVLPLTVANFGEFTPLSPLISVIAGPFLLLVLAAGLPLLFLQGYFPDGPWAGLHWLVDSGLLGLVWVAETSAHYLPALLKVDAVSPWFYLLWALVLMPLPHGPRRWAYPMLMGRVAVALIALILLGAALVDSRASGT